MVDLNWSSHRTFDLSKSLLFVARIFSKTEDVLVLIWIRTHVWKIILLKSKFCNELGVAKTNDTIKWYNKKFRRSFFLPLYNHVSHSIHSKPAQTHHWSVQWFFRMSKWYAYINHLRNFANYNAQYPICIVTSLYNNTLVFYYL